MDFDTVYACKKVTDHHAIIPTAEAVKTDKDSLPESERNILLLLSMKLLSATAQPYRYEAVTASLSCGGVTFMAKGKTVKCEGFKELERRFRATLKTKLEDGKTAKENPLPELTEGQEIKAKAAMTEHDTTPPKAYTEDTLLSAMERAGSGDITEDAERKGLGTPATRAAVLEKLVQAGFVERKKKQLNLFPGVVLVARLSRQGKKTPPDSVVAHPPYGSAQKGRIRSALCCAAVILRRFFCQGSKSSDVPHLRKGEHRQRLYIKTGSPKRNY